MQAEEADEATGVPACPQDTTAPMATACTLAPSASRRMKDISTLPPAPTCKEAARLAAIGCDGVGR